MAPLCEETMGDKTDLAPPSQSSAESEDNLKEKENAMNDEKLIAEVYHFKRRVFWGGVGLRVLKYKGLPGVREEISLERYYKQLIERNLSAESFLSTANTSPDTLMDIFSGLEEPTVAKKVAKARALARLLGAVYRFDHAVNIPPVEKFSQTADPSAHPLTHSTPILELNTDHSTRAIVTPDPSLSTQFEALSMQVDDFKAKRDVESKNQENRLDNIKDLKLKSKKAERRWQDLKPLIKGVEKKLNIPSVFANREVLTRSFGTPSSLPGIKDDKDNDKTEEGAEGDRGSQETNPDSFYNQLISCLERIHEIKSDRRFSQEEHAQALEDLVTAWKADKDILMEREVPQAQAMAGEGIEGQAEGE